MPFEVNTGNVLLKRTFEFLDKVSEFLSGMNAELMVYPLHMRFHCILRNEQLVRHRSSQWIRPCGELIHNRYALSEEGSRLTSRVFPGTTNRAGCEP